MVLKIRGKDWSCKNQCMSNCCSEIFFPLNPEQRVCYDQNGYWIAPHDYTDWDWVKMHNAVQVTKLTDGQRRISVSDDVDKKIIYNSLLSMDMLRVEDKCRNLLKDGRCKVYRARPQICKKADCPVFTVDPKVIWYAKIGFLKEQREKYERGELKK